VAAEASREENDTNAAKQQAINAIQQNDAKVGAEPDSTNASDRALKNPMEPDDSQTNFALGNQLLSSDLGLYQTSPLLDLVQGMHDRLYSRLFNT